MKRLGLLLPAAIILLHGGGLDAVHAGPRWVPPRATFRQSEASVQLQSSAEVSARHRWQPARRRASVPLLDVLRLRGGAMGDIYEGGSGASKKSSRRRRRRRKGRSEDNPSAEDDAPSEGRRRGDGDDASATGSDSALQPDNVSSPGTKKKRRKRRARDEASIDAAPGAESVSAVPEAGEADQSDDAPASRMKKKRRRRRSIPKLLEEADTGTLGPVDSQSDDGQGGASEVEAHPQTDAGQKKKKRRRRMQSKAGAGSLEQGEENAASVDLQAEDAEDAPVSISIDASVEIPSEEIVPESIGAAVEIEEDIHIEPMEDEAAGESPGAVAYTPSDATEPKDTSIQGNVDDAADEDAEDSPVEDSGDETEISEPLESMDDEASAEKEDTVRLDNDDVESLEATPSIEIDASIELPGEEIVPESVGGSVGLEEGLHDIETMEDASLVPDANDLTLAVSNEVEEEAEVVASEDLAEDIVDSPSEAVVAEEEHGAVADPVDGPTDVDISADLDGAELPSAEQSEVEASTGEELAEGDGDEGEQSEDGEDVDEDEMEEDDAPIEVDTDLSLDAHTGDVMEEESGDVMEAADEAALDIEDEEPRSEIHREDDTAKNSETDPAAVHHEAAGESTPLKGDPENAKTEQTAEETDQRTVDSIGLGKMDDDCLTVSIVTWNLGEVAPPEEEASFFRRFRKDSSGVGSDLVLIGAQECEEIKPRRTEGHRSRHLRRMGIQMLGKEYVPLAIHSLGGIQCALYCHRDVLGDVEMINIADVTCGIGNVLHNKGAVGVYLKMKRRDEGESGLTKSSRMLFVTSHLAAHVKNVDARNDDFKRIVSELEAQAPPRFLRPRRNPDGSPAECDGTHLLSSMDHIFFSGDLNYRIDLPREYVDRCLDDIQQFSSKEGDVGSLMKKLLRRDQLLQTIASGRAFPDFSEGQITFLPTFKFDKGTSNYDTSHKQRVPAWTDRILFRSDKVNVLEYRSAVDAKHSDHRPVFGSYQIGWGLKEKSKPKGFASKPKRSRSRKKRD